MQLIYLWTDKFKGIENFELNFFNDTKAVVKDGELKIIHEDFPFENFYDKHISSLKVLVGENGTGKSTVLELLKIICCTNENSNHRKSPNPFNSIVIFKKGDTFLYSSQGKLPFNIDNQIKRVTIIENQVLDDLGFIYYSNSFEYGEKYKNEYSLWDISTIGEIKSSQANFDDNYDSHELKGWNTIFDQFKADEIRRQITLACNLEIELPFNLPKKINLNINEFESTYQYYSEDQDEDDGETDHSTPVTIRTFIEEFSYKEHLTKPYNEQERFLFELLQLAIKSYIETKSVISKEGVYGGRPSYQVDDDVIAKIIENLKSSSLEERFIEFFDTFYNDEVLNQISYLGKPLYQALENLHKFLVTKGTILNNMSAFVYLNDDEIRHEFYACVKDYFDHPFFPSLITFKWNDLSTGEINFLNILSRLYEIKRLSQAKHVVFMIDEGDITLHPEWQRQYISFLVKNIGLLFPGLTYQIMITTHSPIILSDIPSFDIRYMNEESSFTEMKTFGSNIIDLYAKPFVMKHVMGDFAKGKIEKLLGELYKKKKEIELENMTISTEEYQKIANQIAIIGDDIISNRLTEILDSIPQNDQNLRQQLEAAKKRVSDIENKLNRK